MFHIAETARVMADSLVIDEARVLENAVVSSWSVVSGRAVVKDVATVSVDSAVSGNATVMDRARISLGSRVMDRATVKDRAVVVRDAIVSGTAILSGNAVVTDGAKIYGDVWISQGCVGQFGDVFRDGHVIVLGGLFADDPATLITVYRASNGLARVSAGCQNFPLDTPVDALTELAREHAWELPKGWMALRTALLEMTAGWPDDDPQD